MNITIDSTTRIITINKTRYAFDFFEALGSPGGVRIGRPLIITRREKGTISIRLLDPEDIERIYKAQSSILNLRKRGKK